MLTSNKIFRIAKPLRVEAACDYSGLAPPLLVSSKENDMSASNRLRAAVMLKEQSITAKDDDDDISRSSGSFEKIPPYDGYLCHTRIASR